MKITVHSSKAVKPAYDGGAAIPPVATTTATVPLTVFDTANFDTYISFIYAFHHPPVPPNATLEAGLVEVLAEYREWAGRLCVDAGGNRAILLTDEGARFVEATADVALNTIMPLEPTAEVLSLHPGGDDDGGAELMRIQLTRFVCGSLVVGFTMQHIVADGRTISNFFLAWGQATHGVALHPVPVHDRVSLFAPCDPPRVEFEHRGVEFKPSSCEKQHEEHEESGEEDEVVVQKVHLSREFIAELKSVASAGAPRQYSTLVCVVAHLWRCITAARGLDESQRTSLRIAVDDGRARMSPRVPDGYTGNMVLWARPTARAGDLVAAPLWHVAALIQQEVAWINGAYFKSFVDFASSGAVEEERLVAAADAAEMVLSPDVEVDSWLRILFNDLDFGGGRPFFFMPSYLPVEGVLMLVQSFDGDGGIDTYVPLFSRHMKTLKLLLHHGAVQQNI